ncbi:MAG TPA: cyclopropane-fatty-acyl-phospholipid synthase [Dehalococcoidia bacterium]|nr:cyclopropane-fatty-acyl-phospholipid synthase [Chloroflexota bacterium]HCE76271.1 cyclopropane-fatty-acyl-phospholipid synthase [Dehalococcoidia bacterium]|tara:strand:- start:13 stop:1206 length:1194 start_codon:yes stop_codon:yes gene_type:complete
MIEVTESLGKKLSPLILSRFKGIGVLIETPDGAVHRLENHELDNSQTITIKKWSFFYDLLVGYDLGFAESYINEKWECTNLASLFKHLSKSSPDNSISRLTKYLPKKIKSRISQQIRSSNTLKWAKRNIEEHYDLSNEFFSSFLDPSMTYSSAIFNTNDENLSVAQNRKLETLLGNSKISENDKILDIGCGWGSLMLKAASDYNCEVSGVTLSKNQYKYASKLLQDHNLTDKTEIMLMDYRKIESKFDHIFSVEMLEAVGHKGINDFFKKCAQILNKNGTIQVQVITIPDEHYDSYRKNCDFIQKYIFPGGMLPSLGILQKSAQENGFEILKMRSLGSDYVKTLRAWRNNLYSNRKDWKDIGFDNSDYRKFEYYFSYCEGGFDSGHIDNFQISFKRP